MVDVSDIPGFNSNLLFVGPDGRLSVQAINYLNLMLGTLKASITAITTQIEALQQQQASFFSAQNAATTAQQTAANAQATADSGGAARSGNASGTINVGATWSAAAQVDLLTVSAGNLTIEGSGPLQDLSSDIVPAGIYADLAWRIVELPGNVTVFTGTYNANKFTITVSDALIEQAYIYNTSDTSAAAVTIPRVTTGSVSYRLDLMGAPGTVLYNVIGTLYVRRS